MNLGYLEEEYECTKKLKKYSPKNQNYRKAKHIIESSAKESDWRKLSGKLFTAAVKGECINGFDHLAEVSETILDWYGGAETSIKPWQDELIQKLDCADISKVYLFEKHDVQYFWVISKEPTSETIFHYSGIYISVINAYPDVLCDFLVFGANEVDENSLPKDTNIIDIGC